MKSAFGINPYQFSSTHRPFVFIREELTLYRWLKSNWKDVSSGPVVMYTPCNVEDMGLIPGQGTKISHAVQHLSHSYWSLCVTTRESVRHKERSGMAQQRSRVRQRKTWYSLDILLFLFGTSLLFHVQFLLLLRDLHIGLSRGRSGGLVFPSLSEFSSLLWSTQSKALA